MRFYSKALLIFSSVTILFNSCKNDLKILAPYKEAVSVYALLNAQEKRNYIRINKIYLGEGNAYTMATVQDSVNYKAGVLTVTLDRTYNGSAALTTMGNSTKMQIVLQDTVIQTSSGPFNTGQRLWYTDDKLYPDGEYHLTIRNTQTGNAFTASTLMVDSIKTPGIKQPLGTPYYPVAYSPSNPTWYYLDISVETIKRSIEFVSVKNVRDYSMVMRFHYIDSTATGNIARYLDYNFPTVSAQNLDGGEILTVSYYSSEFFSHLYSALIDQTPNVLFRRAVKMDFMVTGASQDYVDFLKISAPSTSVAQDKPAYTNIDGGYGIFSTRSRFHIAKALANNTIDHIATYAPYCDLHFLKSDGTPHTGACY